MAYNEWEHPDWENWFTDEEIMDFSIYVVGKARIDRLRIAWEWCRRRQSVRIADHERRVLVRLAGPVSGIGTLFNLASDLHMVVVPPRNGKPYRPLNPWENRSIDLPEDNVSVRKTSLLDKSEEWKLEVEDCMRHEATMRRAIPAYNLRVAGGYFPEYDWSRGIKKVVNQVLLRYNNERLEHIRSIDKLVEEI